MPETKVLDEAALEKELVEFIKLNGYDAGDPNFDAEKFKNEFSEFLKQKNYDMQGIDASAIPASGVGNAGAVFKSLKNVPELLKI